MNAKELWNKYKEKNKDVGNEYEAWAFAGGDDNLAELVHKGEKTATSSAFPLYEVKNESLPKPDEYSVIIDSRDEAVCIIKTVRISIIPFKDVTEEFARKEGEGDKSLGHWREVHERFFTQGIEDLGMEFDQNMKVVCEEFEVVFKNGENEGDGSAIGLSLGLSLGLIFGIIFKNIGLFLCLGVSLGLSISAIKSR